MAKLPDYRAQRGLNTGSAPLVSTDRSALQQAAAAGHALQNAGQDMLALAQHQQKREQQKEDFATAQNYQQMQLALGADQDRFFDEAPADGSGFTENFMTKGFQKRAQEFFESIPERHRERYAQVLETDRVKWATNAAKIERKRLYESSHQVIGDQQNTFLNQISLDAGAYEESFASGIAIIDAAPIPEAMKQQARRAWEATALAALAGKMIDDDPVGAKRALGGSSAPKFRASVNAAIETAAARYGVSADALKVIALIESGGDPSAKNPNSSAGGLFQFIDGTAEQYGLKDRYDANQAADAGARLMRDNAAGLRKTLRREPTTGELYLAHQQGLAGATKLLSNPNAKAADVVGGKAVKLNGGKPDMTAGQFAAKWISKADGISGADGTGSINPVFAGMDYGVRQKLIGEASRSITKRTGAARQADLAAKADLKALMQSDLLSIQSTGESAEGLDMDAVSYLLGEAEAQKHLKAQQQATDIFNALGNIPISSDAEIDDILKQTEPRPASPNFANEQKVFEAAQSAAKRVRDMRMDAPGEAALLYPDLAEIRDDIAEKAGEGQAITPAEMAAFINRMKETQRAFGTDNDALQLIPLSWAKGIGRAFLKTPSLSEGSRDAVMESVNAIYDSLSATYGEFTDEVIALALKQSGTGLDETTADMIAALMGRIKDGEILPRHEVAKISRAEDSAQSDLEKTSIFDPARWFGYKDPAPASASVVQTQDIKVDPDE